MATISLSPQAGRLSLKDHALTYAALGWKVFPVFEIKDGKCSCEEGADCGRPGKHPRLPNGVNEASNQRDAIESWWRRWPNASIGIATGRASNLTVVDADASDGKPGVINLTRICAEHGGIPQTFVANTGGGGLHLYFNYTDTLSTGSNVLAEAIDVRNEGGYVIAPPSGHISGGKYSWRDERGELKDVPDWLTPQATREEQTRRRGRPRTRAGIKIDKVEQMLRHVDPDDRDKWLKVGLILGRLFVGSPAENEAWTLYEQWAARSDKFDEDRAGNIARMREQYFEESQQASRTGREELSAGTLIMWAREGGWTPWGDRAAVAYEPGNEPKMCEELVAALIAHDGNRFFDVSGEVRDMIRHVVPSSRRLQRAAESGENRPEMLVVRKTTPLALLHGLAEVAVLAGVDRQGAPVVKPIPEQMASMILKARSRDFPVLTGIAEWPMVGLNGQIICRDKGYDATTGLYFDIDPGVVIDNRITAEKGWKYIKEELLADFPFEDELNKAGALGMMLAMLQRQMMKTCPGFAVVAPQPGTGKSTLIEVAALAIFGHPIASHPFSHEDEELRKTIHGILVSKTSAVMFDNVKKGAAISSDQLSKLITSEVHSDRTLGSSEIRREVNSVLVTFTGNNISFVRDMASRVISINLNARTANPLRRNFRHADIRLFASASRNKVLSALLAIAKLVDGSRPAGLASRFEDFDLMIVNPVLKATGIDIRDLCTSNEIDDEDTNEGRALLKTIHQWQQQWRNAANGTPWSASELVTAVNERVFSEQQAGIVKRAVHDHRAWERNAPRALGYALRAMKGDHKYLPYVLSSRVGNLGAQWQIESHAQEEGSTITSTEVF